MGDVHPGGNPHFLYDPDYALRVAKGIADRLGDLDGSHAARYQDSYRRFEARLRQKIAQWRQLMTPFRGNRFVAFHESTIYLAHFLGMEEAGFIEPQPGISPNPRHLARIILSMRHAGVHLVLGEPWYDAETSRVVAQRADATLVRLPGDVGANGVDSYIGLVDQIVRSIAQALQSHA
jgi:zinc/manganese transport system substrate-binding protein